MLHTKAVHHETLHLQDLHLSRGKHPMLKENKHHIVYIPYDENPDETIKYNYDSSKRNTAHCLLAIASIPDVDSNPKPNT